MTNEDSIVISVYMSTSPTTNLQITDSIMCMNQPHSSSHLMPCYIDSTF